VDAGVGIKTRYLWNRSLDGCHCARPFIESTEIGKKERIKKQTNVREQERKKGNEKKSKK